MEPRLAEIVRKIVKINSDIKQGAMPIEPLAEAYSDIEYMISVIGDRDKRISLLEKIIIEDRVNKL